MEVPVDRNPLGAPGDAGYVYLQLQSSKMHLRNLNADEDCSYAFYGCSEVDLPAEITLANCKILDGAFKNCGNVHIRNSALLDTVESMNNTFDGATKVTIDGQPTFDKLKTASSSDLNADFWRDKLATTDFSKATFENYESGVCHLPGNLPSATFRNITSLGYMMWRGVGHISLPEATFENAVSLSSYALSCFTLSAPKAVFGKVTSVGGAAFEATVSLNLESATFESLTNFNNLFAYTSGQVVLHSIDMGNATTATSFCPKGKLDKQSILQIASTIKQYTDGTSHKIDLGIDAALAGDDEVLAALDTIAAKGWTVTHKFN